MGDSILFKCSLTARHGRRRSPAYLKIKNDSLETKTNEEVSARYCGPRRSRRDRASTRSRSRPRTAYTKAPPVYAPIYNWTGFYIGGHIGGAFAGNNGFAGTTNSGSDGRFLGGLQGGADYQFAPNWVVGIEGQYSWLSSNNNGVAFTGAGYVYTHNQRGLGSVTGRLGYTWGPALLYVKGGYAYSDYNESLTFAGVPQAFALNSSHHDGYTVGAGLEYMFAQNWSGKVEYQYYDFGKTNFVTPAVLTAFGSTRNDEHTVKAGINYRFNLGGPVVARF